MNQRIKLSCELYNLNENLALKALTEAKPETLDVRPMDRANSIAWIFVHITGSRFLLGKHLGLKNEFKWAELYNAKDGLAEAGAYPSIDELKEAYGEITSALNSRFEELTDADLDAASPFNVPGVEESIAGAIAALAFHESYHVGQMAYALRLHGGDQLVG
jgi:uncharacterized damage-inducible protein DinB